MKLLNLVSLLLSLTSIVYFKAADARYAIENDIITREAVPGLGTVYEFPNNTWVENLVVRSNSKILVTLINYPQIWQIDPLTNPPSAELLYSFPDAVSVTGITEYDHDIYAVNVGNWSTTTFQGTPGSWSVWSLDLTHRRDRRHIAYDHNATVRKLLDIPHAVFLNGLSAIPISPNIVLSADSGAGVIYRIDTHSKPATYTIFLDATELKANSSAVAPLGVNGIHYDSTHSARGEAFHHIYFTNSFQRPVLSRILVHPNATAAGPVEHIVESPAYPLNLGYQADDFAIDKEGNIWAMTDITSTIVRFTPTGGQTVLAGGVKDGTFTGCTAAQFGRGSNSGVLYITTNGGLADPAVAGIVGGKVLAWNITTL